MKDILAINNKILRTVYYTYLSILQSSWNLNSSRTIRFHAPQFN